MERETENAPVPFSSARRIDEAPPQLIEEVLAILEASIYRPLT
jgi:hypothetical protein